MVRWLSSGVLVNRQNFWCFFIVYPKAFVMLSTGKKIGALHKWIGAPILPVKSFIDVD
jgi:hypothetical protein